MEASETAVTTNAPLVATLTRTVTESEHLVDVVVVGEPGDLLIAGDPTRPVLPRSSIKPIQVLPLVKSGAADAFDVTDAEIALGAASHSGEPEHVAAVDAWLERLGLDRKYLECGGDRPLSVVAADAVLASGASFEPVLNCCSGKHAAFLTIASHMGVDPAGYINPDHPVQRVVTAMIEKYTGADLSTQTPGVDGCGIPTYQIPLRSLAESMRGLVTSTDPAAQRVTRALAANPYWISGTDRHETRLHQAATEPLVAKTGAEGVFMAALPSRGIGIALKTRDGAVRAAEAAISNVLERLGAIDDRWGVTDVTNKAGTVVGSIEVQIS